MDINGTRFHLLLDDADWGRCLDAAGALQGRGAILLGISAKGR